MSATERSQVPGGIAGRAGLDAALAAAGTGTWHWDAATGVVAWDATLERLCGLCPGEFGATYDAWLDTLHPAERDDILSLVQSALQQRSPYRFEHRTVWPDGTIRWLECRGEVLVDDVGDPTGTVGCAVDITARKVAELEQAALLEEVRSSAERLRKLQQVSQQLTGALSVDDVVSAVLDGLEEPTGSAVRALWLVDGPTGVLTLAGQRGMQPDAAEMFRRIDRDAALPGAVAVRERRTVVSPSQADSVEQFPDLHDVPRSAQGFIAVPLVVEHEALGVLAFGYDGPLDRDEIAFLEAAAGNVAQTLTRVRLAEALEERAREIAFLADVTRAAVTATDHRDLVRRIARTAVPRLGDVCALHFVPEPGVHTVAAAADAEDGSARGASEIAAEHDAAAGDVVSRVLRSGRAELVPEGSIAVPIHFEGRVIGALHVVATDPAAAHTIHDLTLARALAASIGEVLYNRWLNDQHRHIATSLQRAFLPPTLPVVPGVEVAAAYWPAGAASDVGGDFYDVFAVGDHEWAVLIGDACGTVPDAAATAAIARHTARAAARHRLGHREVLEWVNEAVMHSDRDLFCTACYATIEVGGTGEDVLITIAVAGHPLPIVVRRGATEPLGTHGTLLGVFDTVRLEVHQTRLATGEAIVFYTDGLTDLPLPHGRTGPEIESILRSAPAAAAGIIDHLRRDLDDRLSEHQRPDDTAMLVIRNSGNPGTEVRPTAQS